MRQHPNADDPNAIERDMERTRAHIDRTIDEIQDRLSPGQLLDEGLRYLRSGPQDYFSTFGSNLGHSIRDNPLPVALIGLGVAWLAMGQNNGQASRASSGAYGYPAHEVDEEDRASKARAAAAAISKRVDESQAAFEHRRQLAMARVLDVKERAGETSADLKARVESALASASTSWESVKQSARRQGRAMRDGTADYMASASDAFREGRSRMGEGGNQAMEVFERQPLLGAAAGITVGALLGALLPVTRAEAKAMEPYGEAVRSYGEAAARQAMDTASAAGRAATGAAVSEVDKATSGHVGETTSDPSGRSGSTGATAASDQPAASPASRPM